MCYEVFCVLLAREKYKMPAEGIVHSYHLCLLFMRVSLRNADNWNDSHHSLANNTIFQPHTLVVTPTVRIFICHRLLCIERTETSFDFTFNTAHLTWNLCVESRILIRRSFDRLTGQFICLSILPSLRTCRVSHAYADVVVCTRRPTSPKPPTIVCPEGCPLSSRMHTSCVALPR